MKTNAVNISNNRSDISMDRIQYNKEQNINTAENDVF